MKKDEILEMSENEKQKEDVHELEVTNQGMKIGALIGLCIIFMLSLVECVIVDTGINYGYLLIVLSVTAGVLTYKAIKLKKKHEILLAVLWSFVAVNAAVLTVLNYIR